MEKISLCAAVFLRGRKKEKTAAHPLPSNLGREGMVGGLFSPENPKKEKRAPEMLPPSGGGYEGAKNQALGFLPFLVKINCF